MASYLLAEIRDLTHQLKLSPAHLCPEQLDGAERLIDNVIDPTRAYPFELVCYHITGYQNKRGVPDGELPGKELIRDLVWLIEELSAARPAAVDTAGETILDSAGLATQLGVSTKTIQRWRSRGLVGRRYLHPDESIQLGFRKTAVDRFVARNPELVRRAASFKNLSREEKTAIIHRARELAKVRRTTLHEVAKKLAAETGRAVETIRYTIRRFDRQHPQRPVFDAAGRPVANVEHERLYRRFRAGLSIEKLAAEASITVATARRICREMRVRKLQANPPEYMYNPAFDAPDAEATLLATNDAITALLDRHNDALLTVEHEHELFRRYNFLKCKARTLLDGIEPTRVKAAVLRKIESLLADADQVRNRIARGNLRLVTSIAKRHVGPMLDMPEVISDGNLSLLRAIEKFDYARGNRFSTYASWAIMRNYARTIPEERYQIARYTADAEATLAATADLHPESRPDWRMGGVREAVEQVLDLLTAKERTILTARFGLTDDGEPHTLEQMGRSFGVTKERIRQIEKRALIKLREAIGPRGYDLFD